MNWFHDKLILLTSSILTSLTAFMGSLMADDQTTRYLLVSFGASTLASAFMAIGFRREEETTKLVVGRCGISIFLGMAIVKAALHYWGLGWLQEDVVALLLATGVSTMMAFLIGYEMLALIGKNSTPITQQLFRWILKRIGFTTEE